MKKICLLFLVVFGTIVSTFAQKSVLSVEKIMQDPSWMGTFPSDVHWSADSKTIYFNYNPENNPTDSLYKIQLSDTEKIIKVPAKEALGLIPSSGDFNEAQDLKVYTRNGILFLYDFNEHQEQQLLELGDRISQPEFLADEAVIAFQLSNNMFTYHLASGEIKKLTHIKDGEKPAKKEAQLSEKDNWLKSENLDLLQVIHERETKKEKRKAYREATKEAEKFTFYTEEKRLANLKISPDAKFVTFNLITPSKERKNTFVPDYTDVTGYTSDLDTRPKVGDEASKVEMAIYNLEKDTVYYVQTDQLPGIKDLPDYVKDYPERKWKEENRPVITSGAYFSQNSQAMVNIRSTDNKDRWIALLDLEDGTLKTLDRQRDEAWIAGPGIGYSFGGGTLGWLPDGEHIYFQSEATGYSHLYLYNVKNNKKKALTKGAFEVFSPSLSRDGKHWYLSSSAIHPGERHFYRMPVMGGKMEKLSSMEGNNKVSLSPDEKHLAILHSYSNQPWELYLKQNSDKAKAVQLTSGQSEAFKAYDWKDPELIHFEAQDGAKVPARLYTPAPSTANGAAVIFVHGAGYLQNAHKWWSSYFREYMFHNLLTDLGYTVLDIDYRGSAGYGRDWRTGIYRHMGGKDLSDQVDGAQYLIDELDIDSEKIGIYGGSYGGFITLMALFNEADTFTSGAALRSVTDWAHYNHGYTSNILNEPFNDPIAYRRSSPIYFAEGLEGNLLIAHGMIDVNVHFQDVVRLSQRLIELGKDNWEMAVYPVEDHGFVEPSSWTDEYKRILKLFNETLLD
ncbi:S9 family peptidase [Echinicola soli]|uniref:S9 family peptidase n=1 Tax=Echinicola soli TaxID=2591634 RepID=A0A514CLH0_9BACT|nr:prolyl oligopeptidase family serine peptidase [Echinicola soli]QDH80659.1 S9 family peptidase [Echinicola soli]